MQLACMMRLSHSPFSYKLAVLCVRCKLAERKCVLVTHMPCKAVLLLCMPYWFGACGNGAGTMQELYISSSMHYTLAYVQST